MKYIQVYLILLCCTLLSFTDITFFTNWIYDNTVESKPTSICSLHVSTSHSWNSFNISNLFIIIIFLWWSVIGDLWCSFIIWGPHKSHPYKCAKSLQVCLSLWPTYWSPSGSSVHGLLHARILEGVVISFYRGSSQPRDRILVSYFSCIGRKVLYHQCPLGSPI